MDEFTSGRTSVIIIVLEKLCIVNISESDRNTDFMCPFGTIRPETVKQHFSFTLLALDSFETIEHCIVISDL
jgi:hypothetical protein